jgi:deoxyribodipyrimidine photo-lyase
MSDLILFWHRRDLRLIDNAGLAQARSRSPKVVGLFCLDPAILQRHDIAAVRVDYMVGCLKALAKRYAEAGSELLILQADPTVAIPPLAQALQASAVYWNWDVEPYAQVRDAAVIKALNALNITVETAWDQLLHAPTAIKSGTGEPYTVYSPFWKNWASQPKAEPYPALANAVGLTEAERQTAQKAGVKPLPTAPALGFTWHNDQILEPGEAPAQERLTAFTAKAITLYDEGRNFPAQDGTSTLSPALKFGAIGPRTLWAATVTAMDQANGPEAQAGITTWRQELAWREFYQHAMFHFPTLADGPYRAAFKNFPWSNSEKAFKLWCEGRTGYPIVDAAMRQLNETGWMHNRCRMIVASFLTKDLIIDWRWGEQYFMQRLVDGDLSANNGGWQWSASSGMDPKPLRIFNPATQAQKFDGAAEYIRQWVPELKGVDMKKILLGTIDRQERDRRGYLQPVVDHATQQRKFKALYAQQKADLAD